MTDLGPVRDVLTDAQRLGFLGPEPVDRHIDHTIAWAGVLHQGEFLDLGSGGGVPGLILASLWPEFAGTLLDGQLRRTAWLRSAVVRLGLLPRVQVVEGRAEHVGHEPELRERYSVVVARSFGPPAPTAECGSAFVRPGGILSVSEPPEPSHRPEPQRSGGEQRGSEPNPRGPDRDGERTSHQPDRIRWPSEGVHRLGLGPGTRVVRDGYGFVILPKNSVSPLEYPRHRNLPWKSPLW